MAEGQTLAQMECEACKGGTPPLKGEALQELHDQLEPGWEVVDEHHLSKEYSFDDFASALAFTNRAGAVAEAQDHHPEICVTYGKVAISVWTHKIGGLSKNDFILAAKIDEEA
jgi:4a-hydroxytetrahydrobiopterin dehydratase